MASCLFNPAGFSALLFVAGGVRNVYVFALSSAYVLSFALGLWQLRRAFKQGAEVTRKSVVAATVLTLALLLPQWLYTAAPLIVGYLGMPRRVTPY
ncbi:hypothetical protein [Terriglobus aquaticus]|nr:hypothetical protein [Terriglobus aquaticus]